jgi:pyruvate dehydrogenase E1 component
VTLPVPTLSAFELSCKAPASADLHDDGVRTDPEHPAADKQIGKHVVPIVPDESRTFGMEGMFRQFGIFSQVGSCTGRRTPTS